MKKLFMFLAVSALLSIISFGWAESPASTTAVRTWKVHTFVPQFSIIYKYYVEPLARLVKEKSNGTLVFELYPVNSLVSPENLTIAVSKGLIEMAINYPAADVGIIPEAYSAADPPFTWSEPSQFLEFWHEYREGEAIKKLDSMYNKKGIKLLNMAVNVDDFGIMTKFPINSMDSLKGKKIRSNGMYSLLVKELKASSVILPLVEIYSGLQTGVVDGIIMGVSGLQEYKWSEVLKYILKPSFFSCGGLSNQVNLDSWNKLPDDLKEIVEQAIYDACMNYLIPKSKEYRDNIMKKLVPEAGITIANISDDEFNTFKKASLPVYQFIEKQSPTCAEIVQMMKAYMDEKGIDYPK